jgi:DNA-binding transcriptional LysR family regulator
MYSGFVSTTFDEWEILQTVVQLGGFAPTAEQLNRSQSTINHAIDRPQKHIGIKLLESVPSFRVG